jgi:hypothetical protein
LHFEVAGGSENDLEQAANALQKHLLELPTVEKAEAVPTGDARVTGVEVVAGIAVGIAIAKHGAELVGGLRKLIEEVKKLRAEFSTKAKEPEEHAASAPAGSELAGSQPMSSEHSTSSQSVTNIIITNIVVDVGFRSVPLAELTEDDFQELVRRLNAA